MGRCIYGKDCDRCSLQCDLNCHSLKVGIQLDWPMEDPLLYVDGDSTTWELVISSLSTLVVAIIVGTLEVRFLGIFNQLCFLQADNNVALVSFCQPRRIWVREQSVICLATNSMYNTSVFPYYFIFLLSFAVPVQLMWSASICQAWNHLQSMWKVRSVRKFQDDSSG